MANPLSGITSKISSAGGKVVDLAAKGAALSRRYGNNDEKLSMGQRVGGALSDVAMNATLGQMGSVGQAIRAGLVSRGNANEKSPTGGSGVPSTTVGGKPIKTGNVVQAISQSTQQMLHGLNTLNSTFRLGLNNTTNQIQAQSSIMGSVKSDSEDMSISLREIYEVLNKQGYQDRNSQKLTDGQRVNGSPVISQNQSGSNILNDLLSGALGSLLPSLMARILPIALPAIATAAAGYFFDMGLGYLGVGGEKIDEKRDKENWDRMNWWQTIESGFARSIENVVGIVAPNMANEAAAARIRDESSYFDTQDGKIKNPNKSRAEAIKTPTATATELTKAEIDEIFRIAPINAADDVLFEIAKQKFPGRKYNTLKQRIDMLHSLMQPQSSLTTGVKVASSDMSSGDYLVSRQKMLENSRSGTSEQALRQEEQKLEKDAFEGVIPQLLNYESREMMYKADKIVFDAGKIEFLEGMGMSAGGEGGDGATKVPELSTETKTAAEQLQGGNAVRVAPGGTDPLGQYSEEQLRSQNIVSHTNADGTKVYNYVPGGIGGHADKIGGSGATEEIKQPNAGMSGRESAVLDMISKREGVTGDSGYDMILGDKPGKPGTSVLGAPPKPISSMTLSELKDWQTKMLQNPNNKWNSSAVGSGQFVKSTLFGKDGKPGLLEQMGIKPEDYDKIKFDKEFQQKVTLENFRKNVGDPNKPETWNQTGLMNQWESFDTRKGFAPLSQREIQSVMSASTEMPSGQASGPTAQAPSLVAGLQGMTPANQQAVAGVGPGNVNVKEAYGPGRPKRPDESIRNIASSAAEKAGMSAITFTSGKGDWISPERKAGGQKKTEHSTGKALDVDGFASDAERAAFIEEAVSMGANGVGVYKGGSIHIDEGDFRSWDLAKKKIYQEAIARGMEKRKKLQEEKQKQTDAEKVAEQKPKVKITEESGQEKAYKKLGVTRESKQKMIAESQSKPAAAPMPPAATPAMLDPTAVQSSQKVSELSKKTTMNREASAKQGPVTQNIVNNSNPKTDTTGTGFPDKNAPMLAMTDTMEKFTSHLFGMA